MADVAIIGIACRFPGARDYQEYWANLTGERSAIVEVPPDRWNLDALRKGEHDSSIDDLPRWAGLVDDIWSLDHRFFSISPREAEEMDPQQKMLMEEAWRCIEDSGVPLDELRRRRTAVFVGAMTSDFLQRTIRTERSVESHSALGAYHCMLANRISHTFGLRGPSLSIDAGHAASLVAVHEAVRAIEHGEADYAIVAGVNAILSPWKHLSFFKARMLSPDGVCRAFDRDANGYVPGEGVGVILLQRASDAKKDRSAIRGVIRGTAVNHSAATASITAPSIEAQKDVIEEAQRNAGVEPSEITYVEAHGTGTPLGDPVEIAALASVFSEEDAARCLVGSVKTNIGHLEAASGIAGLIKVLLMMEHGEIPRTLNLEAVNPEIDLTGSRVELATERLDWPSRGVRIAGVSSFGFGGVNAHVVMANGPRRRARKSKRRRRMPFLLSAKSTSALEALVLSWREFSATERFGALDLEDLCATLAAREPFEFRFGAIVGSKDEIAEALTRSKAPKPPSGKLGSALKSWLAGGEVDWSSFLDPRSRRVALPTYRFDREITAAPEVRPRAGSDDSLGEMTAYLRSVIATKLRCDPDTIGLSDGFVEVLGIDSFINVEIVETLAEALGPLPKTLLFEHSNLEKLSAHLVERFSAPGPLLPDQEEAPSRSTMSPPPSDAIAIIGIAGRFPGAGSLDDLWELLAGGRTSIREWPAERWSADYFDPEGKRRDRSYTRWGGFLEDHDCFDPLFFNITPKQAELIDPQQRIFLETAWAAMENAGLTPRTLPRNSGVFAGVSTNTYGLWAAEAATRGTRLSPDTDASDVANRVSYFLDLHGPSISLDTACSSSLTALHLASQALAAGECEVAFAGAVNLTLHPQRILQFCRKEMLSRADHCHPFGEGPGGFVDGEGVCVAVLKPLERALADGDHIHAVIRGTAVNSEGRTSGYTVPSPERQADLIRLALDRAGVDPRTIGYVEAHGTGTRLGDPIEIEGLTRAFRHFTEETQFCAIGSVKSNIGHLIAAAGMAGLAKVLVQLEHETLVPSLHADSLNPFIEFEATPFRVQRELNRWEPRNGLPRRAAISSFGSGGANGHCIIEELREARTVSEIEGPFLIPLSARSDERLRVVARRLADHLTKRPDADLADVAWTLQTGREAMVSRAIFVAADVSGLIETLSRFSRGEEAGEKNLPEIAARWLAGDEVAWGTLYGERRPRRIPLPSYPFLRQRYWLPEVETVRSIATESDVDMESHETLAWSVAWQPEALAESPASSDEPPLDLSTADKAEYRIKLEELRRRGESPRRIVLAGAHDPENRWLFLDAVHALLADLEHLAWGSDLEIVATFASDLERGWIEFAAVDALLRSASLEKPYLHCRTIGLEGSSIGRSSEIVSREIVATSPHRAVRYVDGVRLVRSAREIDRHSMGDGPLRYGSIVVTGGFGALGLQLAESLTREHGCRVTLIGRRPPDGSARERIDLMKAAGAEILTLEADVTERSQVERALDEVRTRFGLIDGVIHAAGEFRLGYASNDTMDQVRSILGPKIEGAEILDAATAGDDLQYFVLFSSISALIHGEGLGAYSAANACLDAFAELREHQREAGERSGRTISINWPLWSDGGMEIPEHARDRLFETSGLVPMPSAIALQIFPSLLALGQTQCLVLHGDAGRMRKAVARQFTPREGEAPAEPSGRIADERSATLPLDACRAIVRDLVAAEIGIPADEVDPVTELSVYGLDSVNLRQITMALEERFAGLPKTLLLEHRTVDRVAAYLSNRSTARPERPDGDRAPAVVRSRSADSIAIVGMSGRYPDAPDLDTFWTNLRQGRSSIGPVPAERWSADDQDGVYCRWGAFLSDVDKFDPLLFEITPVEAKTMHPEERLLLENAWTTFESAGYARESLRGSRTGVFVGVNSLTYPLLGLNRWSRSADVSLDTSYYPLPNRISYFFDLDGPSVPVDTGCSSALVAIHLACESIRRGDCDSALVAAVNLYLHPSKYWLLCRDRMLASSPSGLFRRGGEGFIPGEGVGSVVLKPLERALSDGDTIHGVIRGSAVAHKGRSSGFLAPEPRSLASLFRRALEDAEVDPSTVGSLEIQATGAEMADAAEWQAIEEIYGSAANCAVGSLKPNIGHLESAAGMAQLHKILLQMRHGEVVAPRVADELNDGVRLGSSSLSVPDRTSAWHGPRRAAITSIAAGGTGAHLIVEEYRRANREGEAPAEPLDEVVILSAPSPGQLTEMARNLSSFVAGTSEHLADIAFTLQVGRSVFEHRFAAVVRDHDHLVAALGRLLETGDRLHTGETGRHADLARRWVDGATVDWTSELGDRAGRRRVPLPTHPFERKRCWLYDDTTSAPSSSSETEETVVSDYYNRMTDVIRRQTNGEEDELYILFAPFASRVEGFSWIKSFFEPAEHPDHVATMLAKQKEMKEVIYRHVDFDRVRSVFDIGCGLGTDLIQLARTHPSLRADGFTITPRQAELGTLRVRRAGLEDRVSIHCADSTRRPFPGRYDLVLGFEVIFHIEDKDAVFANIASHLSDDGIVVLADGVTNTVTEIDLPHLGQYTATPEQFSAVLSRHGLRIDDCVDTSLEISNFLHDDRFEDNLAAVNARHPELEPVADEHRCWDSFGKVLGQRLIRYLLFSIRKARAGASESELRRHNEARIREARPYSEVAPEIVGTSRPAAPVEQPIVASSSIEDEITRLAAGVLEMEPDRIDRDARFVDYGVGSLQGLLILDAVNRHYGIGMKMPVLYDHSSLRDLAKHVGTLGVAPTRSVKETAPVLVDRSSDDGAIAVIGIAARFPGAPDARAFWRNLRDGVDSIREVPRERWDVARWYDPDPDRANHSYSRWAGIVDDVDRFDAGLFRISPHDAALMDPQQRLFLESCWTALEDAGCSAESVAGSRCGVWAGVMGSDYRELLDASGRIPEAQTLLGNDDSILASRISYFLNTTGPAMTIKTACSSSLVAVHLASSALRSGEADLALAGGVTLYLHHKPFVMMSRAGMLSPTGRCRPFDESADGIAVGDGCGVVVLKRMADALRDGDRIYGVIRGSGVNQDGKTNGITAPSMASQKALELDVLSRTGINPESISFVEAHGTGTKLGDPIEVAALTDTFRQWTDRRHFCALGSVKSNIGHTTAAAGVAGLIKVLLSMEHRQIPPTLHFERANEHIDLEESPFFVNRDLREWRGENGAPLRATVSAFAFNGTNCFLVVDEPPHSVRPSVPVPAEGYLVPLSARTPERLRAQASALLDFLRAGDDERPSIEEIAYTLQTGRTRMRNGAAFLARSIAELEDRLATFLRDGTAQPIPDTLPDWPVRPRKVSLPTYPFARDRHWFEATGVADVVRNDVAEEPTSVFVRRWIEAPASGKAHSIDGPVVVFETDDRLSTALRETHVDVVTVRPGTRGEKTGENAWRVRPDEPEDLAALMSDLERSGQLPKRIVYAWPAEVASPILGAVSLTNAIASRAGGPRVRVLHLHQGDPSEAAIAGFARSLASETTRIRWSSIEVDGGSDAEIILRECDAEDPEVRYSDGARLVPRLEFAAPAREIDEIVRAGTTWIVTGGGGALGRIFATWLRDRGADVIACGRTQPADLPSGISFLRADVSNREDVGRLIAEAKRRHGAVHGIIHAAGVIRDALTSRKTHQTITEVVAPKVDGAILLDELTRNEPLESFVMLSSVAGVIGNRGQSDYAYANAFLDRFAEQRERMRATGERRGRTLSISWPLWQSGGMSVSDEDAARLRDEAGLVPMPTAAALDVWETMFASDASHLVVVHGDADRFRRAFESEPEPIADGPLRDDDVRDQAEMILKRVFARHLEVPIDELDSDVSFEEYGIDSIMINAFNASMERIIGPFPRTVLFDYKTIGDLAGYFASHHASQIRAAGGDASLREERRAESEVHHAPRRMNTDADSSREGIAIIGISGRYPQAPDLDRFWENLERGVDAVGTVPADRWDHARYSDRIYTDRGAFLENADRFDPLFFGISPREAERIDPQERIFLECAWSTIEDAGHTRATLGRDVGVFVGVTTGSYALWGGDPAHRDDEIPESMFWSIANRVSFSFDFSGPSMPVDTACSASLTAIHLACESLRKGECASALAGGVNLYLHPAKYAQLCQLSMLSRRGRCSTFGDDADGFVPGEGVGAVLLKPLRRAIEDGDRIHAVIRGSAINHGGRTNGYTVPSPQSQAALLRASLESAGVDPADITCVEAHGTGTALGDPVEIAGLTQAWGDAARQSCAIGSVKSNIGHLESAAGIAGLTKIVLQMRHGRLAPSLHSEPPNRNIEFATTPFRVQKDAGEWRGPRIATISSFGAGGANANVIIEEYARSVRSEPAATPHLFVLSAKSPEALRSRATQLVAALDRARCGAADVAWTLQTGREPMPERLAIVAGDLDELKARLRGWLDGASDGVHRGTAKKATSNPDMTRLVAQRDLAAIAAAWIAGSEVDWPQLHRVERPERVSLPTYPFEGRRYWIGASRIRESVSSTPVEQTFLSGRETKLRRVVRPEDVWVAQHVVEGAKTLAGMWQLELAREAAASVGGIDVAAFSSIVWLRRVTLEEEPLELRIGLVSIPTGFDFKLFSGEPSDGSELLHVQGKIDVGPRPDSAAQVIDVIGIRGRCRRSISHQDFYDSMRHHGLDYGPAFRVVQEAHIDHDEVIARLALSLESRTAAAPAGLNPAAVDGGLQLITLLIGETVPPGARVPFSLSGVELCAPIGSECYAWAKRRGDMFDVVLCDVSGRPLVKLDGLQLRATAGEPERRSVRNLRDLLRGVEAGSISTSEAKQMIVRGGASR